MHTRRTSDRSWAAIRQQENARKRDGAHRIPSRWSGPPPELRSFLVLGGNLLFTIGANDFRGILYPASAVAAVPTVNPVIASLVPSTTYTDGLGVGLDKRTNSTVWISTRCISNSIEYVDFQSGLYLTYVTCRLSVDVTCTAGGTATVWLPWLV